MMAFTTHFCRKIKSVGLFKLRVGAIFLCLIAGLGFNTPSWATDVEPEVTLLKLQRSDEGLFLTASLKFELSQTVEDALLKGIPVYFVAELMVYRERWYWLDSLVLSAQRSYRLVYQPLTRRWRLTVANLAPGKTSSDFTHSGNALSQYFDSLPEALRAIQYLAQWRVARPSEIELGMQGRLEFSFRLDWNQLPRSFQIGSVGRNAWNVNVSRSQRLQVERLQ
jgi:hypothetical protein